LAVVSASVIAWLATRHAVTAGVGVVQSEVGYCTGTLIDRSHVLTAAHCFAISVRPRFVIQTPSGRQEVSMSDVALPDFKWFGDGKAAGNDFAVASLQRDVPGVEPIPIADSWETDLGGARSGRARSGSSLVAPPSDAGRSK
jgi:hypothetical protein